MDMLGLNAKLYSDLKQILIQILVLGFGPVFGGGYPKLQVCNVCKDR